MIRQIKNVIDTELTHEEREILAQADEILYRLQLDLGNKLNMMALESGEIISTDELGRVRGILDSLSNYRIWKLSINERMG